MNSNSQGIFHALEISGTSSQRSTPGLHLRRILLCRRCEHHGHRIQVKGHKRDCPYRRCGCDFCSKGVTELDRRRAKDKYREMRTKLWIQKITGVDKRAQTLMHSHVDISRLSLSKDFGNLLKYGVWHDTEIKCGDNSIKVHKIILSARSNVFKTMLESDMVEGRFGVIYMNDIEISDLRHFIWYLYTDELPDMTVERAIVLYETADFYNVRSLMDRCSAYLQDNLSEENVDECLQLANLHSDDAFADGIKKCLLDRRLYLRLDFWSSFSARNAEIAEEVARLSFEDCGKLNLDKCVQTASYRDINVLRGSLSEDFGKLFHSHLNKDVEIKCRDNTFKVHKSVLSARHLKLKPTMDEGGISIIDIWDDNSSEDINNDRYNMLHDFIWYQYTGEIRGMSFDRTTRLYENALTRRINQYSRDVNYFVEMFCECINKGRIHPQFNSDLLDLTFKVRAIDYILTESLSSQFDELPRPLYNEFTLMTWLCKSYSERDDKMDTRGWMDADGSSSIDYHFRIEDERLSKKYGDQFNCNCYSS